jgi:hypothetical protein
MKYSEEDITLNQTCGACPEQYEAFIGDRQVGYLRLRHGLFRVDYPRCGDETIFECETEGDGIFDSDERDIMLRQAKLAILERIADRLKNKI